MAALVVYRRSIKQMLLEKFVRFVGLLSISAVGACVFIGSIEPFLQWLVVVAVLLWILKLVGG